MLEFVRRRPLWAAWLTVLVWLLSYVAVKLSSVAGLDIDGAEQVYFAQSWQLGYGTRQPPLYTWMLLALRPDGGSWPVALEVARYAVLLAWLGGTQALARACGASAWRQALVVVAHLGFLLAMWRVHDSLTHTVLAAALTTWASAATVKALRRPAWWPVVGLLAALACLAKLNAALWCASAVLAWAWLQWRTRDDAPSESLVQTGLTAPRPGWLAHLAWLGLALLLFAALLGPYAQWWWVQREVGDLPRRVLMPSDAVPPWQPPLQLALGTLEYLMLTPALLAGVAWGLRWRHRLPRPVLPGGLRWLAAQTLIGLLVLAGVVTALKGAHFTPRWLWPVLPGATVWLVLWACEVAEQHARQTTDPRWPRRLVGVAVSMALLSIAVSALRWWEPERTAQRCRNCWTDRPAVAFSHALHQWHGEPLRVITGDDHLAGILSAADGRDLTWTAVSPDLPPPQGFATTPWTCVAAWVDMDAPQDPPAELMARTRGAWLGPVQHQTWPLRLAPQRRLWLQSVILDPAVCDRARP